MPSLAAHKRKFLLWLDQLTNEIAATPVDAVPPFDTESLTYCELKRCARALQLGDGPFAIDFDTIDGSFEWQYEIWSPDATDAEWLRRRVWYEKTADGYVCHDDCDPGELAYFRRRVEVELGRWRAFVLAMDCSDDESEIREQFRHHAELLIIALENYSDNSSHLGILNHLNKLEWLARVLEIANPVALDDLISNVKETSVEETGRCAITYPCGDSQYSQCANVRAIDVLLDARADATTALKQWLLTVDLARIGKRPNATGDSLANSPIQLKSTGVAKTGPSEPPGPADRTTILASLQNCQRQAYQAADYAIAKGADAKTDEALYLWLKDNGAEDYELPAHETFTRYLREARKALGEQKNTPRAGRPTGKSVVRADQL